MSIIEQKRFLTSIHPFDTLDEEKLSRVLKTLQIGYYPADHTLCERSEDPQRVYMIIKGSVEAIDDEGEREYFGPLDTLCALQILRKQPHRKWSVAEELLCYEIPKEIFLELVETEESFRQYYLEDLARRIQTLRRKKRDSEIGEFLSARITEIYLHPPYFVNGECTIEDAVAGMERSKSGAILVKDRSSIGIVTDSDLRHSVIVEKISPSEPIGKIATFGLKTIERDDFLFNALLQMTKFGIKRLAVTEKGRICGLLEQIDLLSYFSNHSYLIGVQIERAQSVEALKEISRGFFNIVSTLHHKGVKARYIARIVSELNGKIYKKVFELTIPKEWHDKMAIVVMGSEGRSEQIVRTDQDNGAILEDGFHPEDLKSKMELFSDALSTIGFPECPGGVMVRNERWCKNLKSYKDDLKSWIETPDGDSMMHLAILLDARAVAGKEGLCDSLRTHLFREVKDHPTALALFASQMELFEIPIGWFGTLKDEKVDLKKGGTFTLMHGVRSLALDKSIYETSTIDRIKRLNDIGLIDKEFAQELIEAYDVLLELILEHKLGAIKKGVDPDTTIELKELGKIERDMLKEALKIVKKLKEFVAFHFKTNMVG